MNAMTKLDSTATETLVKFLSGRFEVTEPNIEFSSREANRGIYWGSAQLIRLSRNACLWVVAHEFTHHLDHAIHPDRDRNRLYHPQGFRRPHTERVLHGEAYFYNLLRVIKAVGVTDYPWGEEYKQLQRWARSRSLLVN